MGTFAHTAFGNDYALDWVASLNACRDEAAVARLLVGTFEACVAFDRRNGGKGVAVDGDASAEAASLQRKDLDPDRTNGSVLAVVRALFTRAAREPVLDYGAREACAAVAAAAYAARSPEERRGEPEIARLVRAKPAREYTAPAELLAHARVALRCAARNQERLNECGEGWLALVQDLTTHVERRVANG